MPFCGFSHRFLKRGCGIRVASDRIVVRGARVHNLKNVTVEIPRDKLVVITGVSGSGKSSLAFDTIYAEGQRRYVESLSAYARQFLGQMDKPDVDGIDGLSPAIAVDQKGAGHNPRSTVGTVTEIYDHIRLLFARVGHPHCPQCGREVARQTVEQIVDAVLALPDGCRIMIVAPLVRDRRGEHHQVLEEVRRAGFARVRVDGEVRDLGDEIELDRQRRHTVEVVVDRLVVRRPSTDDGGNPDAGRVADSIETALKLGSGVVLVSVVGGPDVEAHERLFSERFACAYCGISLPEIEPRTFSFNNPLSACPACGGLGTTLEIDPDLVIPNPELSLAEGAVEPWGQAGLSSSYYAQLLEAVARHAHIPLDRPVRELAPEQVRTLLHGMGAGAEERVKLRHADRHGRVHELETTFEGVIPNLERRYREASGDRQRWEIEAYMSLRPCPTCKGARLKPESLAVTVADLNVVRVTAMSVGAALRWFREVEAKLAEREALIARPILKEISARLRFLADVGLDYLTLDRAASTLSGGESQRIRLATQIGSSLMGVLYILDEPSIGLHQRDNRRLIGTLLRLRDLGNTVLVVEHDEETIRSADYVVDVGPGAGERGGQVVAAGPLSAILACPESVTGQFLRRERAIRVPGRRRPGNGRSLVVKGARANNLKNLDVEIPLGRLVCVTGVSGSGKSTLVTDILYRKAAQALYRARERPGEHDAILGLDALDKVVDVDQSPIGRTPRSNPATYTGLFGPIRDLFASVPEARVRGYQPGRFSFNVKGGRCEACQGEGIIQIEMQFLPDVYVPCEVCKGRRFNRETLEIRYKGKNVAEVLEMTVAEALEFFEAIPALRSKLQVLDDVGLGYIRLGQPATTLSGGEAQRVKLAAELSRRATGRTLYVLDEPTTGLHFADVERLLHVLGRLVDAGNSVLVIEHDLDVVKCADWVIDLGPEGGDLGGYVVAAGTPEDVAQSEQSYTGRFLRAMLEGGASMASG